MEEQFYLLWPMILVACLHRSVRRSWLVCGLLAALTAVTVLRFTLALADSEEQRRSFGPDVRSGGLLVGCLLALSFTAGRSRAQRVATWLATLLVAATITGLHVHGAPLLLFHVAVAGLLVAALTGGLVAWLLRRRLLVFFGRISYGLYLWHGLLLAGVQIIPDEIGAVVAVGMAWLSFEVIEQPFLRRKTASRQRLVDEEDECPLVTVRRATAPG